MAVKGMLGAQLCACLAALAVCAQASALDLHSLEPAGVRTPRLAFLSCSSWVSGLDAILSLGGHGCKGSVACQGRLRVTFYSGIASLLGGSWGLVLLPPLESRRVQPARLRRF